MRFISYYERTTWIPRRKKSDPDLGWGILTIVLIAAGAVSNGWSGAVAGFVATCVIYALFGPKDK